MSQQETAVEFDADEELAAEISKYYADPLGFVLLAYPWGVAGTALENEEGPDDNQREFLNSLGKEVESRGFNGSDPVMPIRMAESSGHGTGKSAMGAWLADWILSTRPNSVGTVTAGTYKQLDERTWAAIMYWTKLCITSHWFDIQAEGIYHKNYPTSWKVLAQTCKEENAQSFAGQHARTSTSWYLFDEASEVPDKVFDTADPGGLTDGEPMFFVWGQLVRNTGRFYEICYGNLNRRWNHRKVDSRTSRFTNKALIEQLYADYGPDSDMWKVRILGEPPSASELQFIDWKRVIEAQSRIVKPLSDEPLIAGMDVSGGGSAWNVIAFRRGADARTIPRVRISGEAGRNRNVLVGRCAELLADKHPDRRIDAMFVDSAFGAPIVERLKVMGFKNVHEVSFGSESMDQHQANMRAYMWNKMKDWLLTGALPKDENLGESHKVALQITRPGYHINRSNKLVLESKADMQKRGEASPDDADALALTFAMPVALRVNKPAGKTPHISAWA